MSKGKDVQAKPEPEFSRPILLGSLGDRPMQIRLEADEKQREALAKRFDLISLGMLTTDISLTRDGDIVTMDGAWQGELKQSCAVSGEPVAQHLDEALSLRFAREAYAQIEDEEEGIELSPEDCDTLPHDGRAVDVGEALAQTMALALDPFPRSEAAEEYARAAGLKTEDEAGPFGALAALRSKMDKGS